MAGYFARPRSQRARTAAEGPSLARRMFQAPLEFLHADNLSRMFSGDEETASYPPRTRPGDRAWHFSGPGVCCPQESVRCATFRNVTGSTRRGWTVSADDRGLATTRRGILMAAKTLPGGTFTVAEDLTVTRMGYGAMQLAGPGVFGPPKDRD